MKKTFYVVASAVLSLLLHVFVLRAADRLQVSVFQPREAEKKPRRIELNTRNLRDQVFKPRTVKQQSEVTIKELRETIKNSKKIEKVFEANNLVEKPKPKLRLADLGRNMLKPKLPTAPAPMAATAPRPKIVEIDAQGLSAERLSIKRQLHAKVARTDVSAEQLPSLLPHGPLTTGSGKTWDVGMKLGGLPGVGSLQLGGLPGQGILDRMTVEEARRRGFGSLAEAPDLPSIGTKAARGRSHQVKELDTLVSVTMTVHEERTGGGFFRIDIAPNERSERLRPIPKDILFVVDCSASISGAKLEQFKAGIDGALPYLTKRDRFNIISFKDKANKCFPDFVPVKEESIAAAQQYAKQLSRGGMTDVFAGLMPAVDVDDDATRKERPLNVFLMSDGKSTVSGSLANEELIRRIVKMNRAHVSIYSFSAGKSANLFLLDFLAYHNRGLSLHESKLADFRGELVEYISSHASLIVADLEYLAPEELRAEIFPKRLPHLYRGEALSIYGRFPPATEEIVISIVGRDASGDLEELIFRGKVAESEKASARLTLDWAAQKVFHLIGLRTLEPSPRLDQEVRELAQKYNLFVPY
ncbi:MAG: VWA domain-containing protein [Lentisphaerae bacterium]|jgi:Mg-chelatase subunit ChlD|nr:VWA domain-containing protein [Lentisphaerota bacterium]MBT4818412.1 VWA domain-containing protein [Lentisphaerota bacterium]MBT5610690.1 VWA domain-containing protein [Lentisphaerota bacterium]MBT7058046.1 VWA domain-containing protein [Lentisphaerota bacterium]MBT7840668.1 VWA domain-containing protein [Lentisphaerota bacterium]